MVHLTATKVSCRLIETADIPAIIDLLCAGFPKRRRSYWLDGLQRMARHSPPEGFPKFGHMLHAPEGPVGVHLMISSRRENDLGSGVHCNVSSWYVKQDFRAYATFLISKSIKERSAGYLNIGPELTTVQTIEALGFTLVSKGIFAGLPGIARAPRSTRVTWNPDQWKCSTSIPPGALRLLTDHHDFGCIGFWCESPNDGQSFIFRRRSIKPGGLPCAQLLYYEDLEAFERFAGIIGRRLARMGMPLMLVPSHRPLRGLTGKYFPEKLPLYFKGVNRPGVGDLSYTEAAMFGL
jgi:hypothetical protein